MVNKISISDVSLKNSTESTNGYTFKEKLNVAKKLSELSVDAIELGPVANDKADEVLIKTVATCTNRCKIACHVGLTEKSVEKNFSLISSAKNKRLIVSVPVSPVQMEYFVSKKPKAVIDLLKTLTEKSVSLNSDVEVVLTDATRAEPAFLYQAVKTAIDGGAKIITLTDIAGTMLPSEFSSFIGEIYQNVPELKKVVLGLEITNIYSTAITNIFEGIKAGATLIKFSVLGLNGLAPIENFSTAISNIPSMKGYALNLNVTALKRILNQIRPCGTVEERSDLDKKEENEEIAQNITRAELNKKIKQMGYELTTEDLEKVYSEYLRIAAKKKVNAKELDVIVASNAMQVPATYTLTKYSVQTSNVITPTASISLSKGSKELGGLAFGTGSIDAAFRAIEEIIGAHFELDDFSITSISEGKESVAETVVKLRNGGKIYSGRGVSTDIVGAGIRAYVNAVNKIVFDGENK